MHIEPKSTTIPVGRMVQRDDGVWVMKLLPGDGKRIEFAWYEPDELLPVNEPFAWHIEAGIEGEVVSKGHEWCLWQWHGPLEPALTGSNPPMMLVFKDGVGSIRIHHEYSQPFDNTKKRSLDIATGIQLTPGRLYRWNIEAKIAEDGFVKVRRDGVLLADYAGPIGYHMEGKPYAKAGIYKWLQPWAGEIRALVRF